MDGDIIIEATPTNANAVFRVPIINTNNINAIIANANCVVNEPSIITNNVLANVGNSNANIIAPFINVGINITVVSANATGSMPSTGMEIWEGKYYQCWVSGVERDVTLSETEREVTITVLTISKNNVVI